MVAILFSATIASAWQRKKTRWPPLLMYDRERNQDGHHCYCMTQKENRMATIAIVWQRKKTNSSCIPMLSDASYYLIGLDIVYRNNVIAILYSIMIIIVSGCFLFFFWFFWGVGGGCTHIFISSSGNDWLSKTSSPDILVLYMENM
jgi:hypothetical protein